MIDIIQSFYQSNDIKNNIDTYNDNTSKKIITPDTTPRKNNKI